MGKYDSKYSFFEYVNLAKKELGTLVRQYPELSDLSPREFEVFELLLSDKTLAEIAEELIISYSAVHYHCKNIYRKLEIKNRRQFLITYRELVND